MATFTDLVGALATQKRKARLQGRPLSEQEIRGTTAGYFDVASQRVAQARALRQQQEQAVAQRGHEASLQAERLESSEEQLSRQLAEQKRSAEESAKIQREQLALQERELEEELRAAQQAREAESKWEPLQWAVGIGSALSLASNFASTLFGASSSGGGLFGAISKLFD